MTKKRLPNVDDVVSGRVRVGLSELLDLVHEVNPTGRTLSPKEARRRYALKSALQSMLLRRFASELELRLDPATEVVAIEHRSRTRDACHAVLSELDDEARSIVRRRIDDGAVERTDARPTRSERAVAGTANHAAPDPEALIAAREALAEFDYERAREILEDAFDGSPRVAQPLLELLVDTLALDADALALSDRLATESLASPAIRLLLATAAVRSGDVPAALRWVGDAQGATAGEVVLLCARARLHEGLVDEAESLRVRAAELGASGANAANVARAIEQARARQRAPMEAELDETLARGDHEGARVLAARILSRWADSARARAAVRVVDDARRAADAARLLAEAEDALGRDDRARALARMLDAIATGGLPTERRARVEEQAEQLRGQLAADAREREARASVAALSAGITEASLSAYLELDPTVRQAVRARVDDEELRIAEAVVGGVPKARVRAAAAAVLALRAARELVEAEPARARELIVAHPPLAGLDAARVVIVAAEQRLHARARELASARLREAEGAWAHGDLARAHAARGAIVWSDLEDHDLPRADELRRAIDRAREAASLERDFEHAVAAGDTVRARRVALGLAASAAQSPTSAGPDGAVAWRRRAEELAAETRRTWNVSARRVEPPSRSLRSLPSVREGGPHHCATADGTRAYLATCSERWVLVEVLDLRSACVVEELALRPPVALGGVEVEVDDDGVWLAGDGGLVCLEPSTWTIETWTSFAWLRRPGRILERCVTMRAQRAVWIEDRDPETNAFSVRVADLDRREILRGGIEDCVHLARGDDRHVVTTDEGEDHLVIHRARGGVVRRELVPGMVGAAHRDVQSGEWTVLTQEENGESSWLSRLATASGIAWSVEIPGIDGTAPPCQLAHTRDVTGHAWHVLSRGTEGGVLIVQLDASGGAPLEVARTEWPDGTFLATDAGETRLFAVCPTLTGTHVVQVSTGVEPPVDPLFGARGSLLLPQGVAPFRCTRRPPEWELDLALVRSWREADEDGRARLQERALDAGRDAVLDLVDSIGAPPAALMAAALDRWPQDAGLRLVQAEQLSMVGAWTEARAEIDLVSAADLPDWARPHLVHMRAAVALALGDAVRAHEIARAGLGSEGTCSILPFVLLDGRALGEGDFPPYDWRFVAGRVLAADACLRAGRWAVARSELDHPAVGWLHDEQVVARIVEAHLADDLTPLDIGRIRAASRYIEARELRGTAPSMIVPGAMWPEARLAEIERRARAALYSWWADTTTENSGAVDA